MNTSAVVMIVVACITGIGGIIAAIWTIISGRHKPDIDRAQLKEMVDKSNIWRDKRLVQLEMYLNAVVGWQFDVVGKFRQLVVTFKRLKDTHVIPDDCDIPDELPEPPPIPEPPSRD